MKLKLLFNFLLVFTVVFSLGTNYKAYESTPPIYVGHLFVFLYSALVIFICVILTRSLIRHPSFRIYLLMVVLFLIGYASVGYLYGSPRFFSEFGKLFFTLFTFYALSVAYANFAINPLFVPFGIASGVLLSTVTVVNLQDLAVINLANRLDAESLGNFNAYSFLVANAMLCLFFLLDTTASRVAKIGVLMCLGYLSVFLLASFSRNGMLGLIVGISIFMITSARAKIVTVALPIFLLILATIIHFVFGDITPFAERYILSDDLQTGTGRLVIWNTLLTDIFASPRAILFGFGMGSIDTEVEGGHSGIFSAHNSFLQLWYEFGSIVFLGAVYGAVRLWRGIRRVQNLKERAFLYAIFGQIAISLFFDSLHQSSQIGWVFALWVASIMAATRIGGMRQSCNRLTSACKVVAHA